LFFSAKDYDEVALIQLLLFNFL